MDSENAKWYWEKKASDYPGLNIKVSLSNTSFASSENWLLIISVCI